MFTNKIVKAFLILVLLVSLGFNYYLYKETGHFIVQIGTEYQNTVRSTLNELADGSPSSWIETFKEEGGDVRLERHLGKLRQYSRGFDKMNGEMSAIGILLNILVNQYYELKDRVNNGENYEEISTNITNLVKCLNTVLTQIKSNLGENERLWYKELSGNETDTQKYVWEKFKEFEKQNK